MNESDKSQEINLTNDGDKTVDPTESIDDTKNISEIESDNSDKPQIDKPDVELSSPEQLNSPPEEVIKAEDLKKLNEDEVVNLKQLNDDLKIEDLKNFDDDESLLEIVERVPKKEADDEEYVEETVIERLIGLTEMFPDPVRNASYSILSNTFPLIRKSYNFTRNYGWIIISSFAILVVPVSLEKERCEAQRELNRQMLLGGGDTSAGPKGLSLAPAPVSK